MNFVYKKISNEILAEIVELFVDTFHSEPWNECWTIQTASKRLRPMVNFEDFYGLCVYQDNIICGFIMGFFEQYCDGLEFTIKEFAIRNSGRGQGIGSQLYGEFETRLKDMNVKRITLLTLRGNLTEHFYIKNGFQTNEQIAFMGKTI